MSLSVGTTSTFNNFIAGCWAPPAQAHYLTIRCEAGATRLPSSGTIDVDHALSAAKRASNSWAHSSLDRRLDYLAELGRLMGIYEKSQRFCVTSHSCAASWRASSEAFTTARQYLFDPESAFMLSDLDPPSEQSIMIGKIFLGSSVNIADAFHQITPALTTGYTLVVALLHEPDQQECLQLMSFMEFAAHSLPPGVLNIIYGLGIGMGVPLLQTDQAVSVDFLSAGMTSGTDGSKTHECH